MHKPGHKQKYSNRPSVSDLPKREESKRKNIQNLTALGQDKSMQEFVSKAYNTDYNVDEYRRENLWKQWKKAGSPEVRQWEAEEFMEYGSVHKDPQEKAWWHNKPRAFYQNTPRRNQLLYGQPESKRMTITPGNVDEFLSELAHSAQKPSIWDEYKFPKLRKKHGEKVYDMPGNIEYEAHSIIEPKMQKEYWESSPE